MHCEQCHCKERAWLEPAAERGLRYVFAKTRISPVLLGSTQWSAPVTLSVTLLKLSPYKGNYTEATPWVDDGVGSSKYLRNYFSDSLEGVADSSAVRARRQTSQLLLQENPKSSYEGTSNFLRRHPPMAWPQYNFPCMATISEASPTALLAPTIESSPAARGLFSSSRKRNVVLSLLLVLATLALYNGIVHNAFINVDDNGYVTENEHVHAGLTPATLRWALTTFACENWHPLTWVSHALDWQLFGKNAAGHHYMSVLLHALNAVLLFLLLQSATGFTWRSLVVAALFAVHPVNVESVAWAAERKNVLSMMFFLLAMLAYGWYAQRPSVRRYASV